MTTEARGPKMPVDNLNSFRSAYTLVAISWPFFSLIEMKGLTSYQKSPSQLTVHAIFHIVVG
jgi:hypothetical protein